MSNEPKTYAPFTKEDADRIRKNFPRSLIVHNNWVAWKLIPREDGKAEKKPICAFTGKPAKTSDSNTWSSFDVASEYAVEQHLNGVGFVFGGLFNNLIGIDLDDCLANGRVISQEIENLVNNIGSYCEISPSGIGLHIFCLGDIAKDIKIDGVEVYQKTSRYMTTTGRVFNGLNELRQSGGAFQQFYEKLTASITQPRSQPKLDTIKHRKPICLSDDALFDKMFSCVKGKLWQALFLKGDWVGSKYSSQSEADIALIGALGFWTGYDAERADKLFRQSKLYRDKWDDLHCGDVTYGEMTIQMAFSDKKPEDGYTGRRPPRR